MEKAIITDCADLDIRWLVGHNRISPRKAYACLLVLLLQIGGVKRLRQCWGLVRTLQGWGTVGSWPWCDLARIGSQRLKWAPEPGQVRSQVQETREGYVRSVRAFEDFVDSEPELGGAGVNPGLAVGVRLGKGVQCNSASCEKIYSLTACSCRAWLWCWGANVWLRPRVGMRWEEHWAASGMRLTRDWKMTE